MLLEKIVAEASAAMVVIADESKLVKTLGTFPLPVEVAKFGHERTAEALRQICGAEVALRGGGDPFITQSGHHIYDCACGRINDPAALAAALDAVAGVVGHGLFLGLAKGAIIAGADGIRELGDL